jgi:NTP pyrophosphatase (non-canonical NTP hydrolase)
MSKPLTKFQRLVAETYEGGEFSWVRTEEGSENVGDGLFSFLIREAGQAGKSPDELLRMMRKAEEEVREVADAVEKKLF